MNPFTNRSIQFLPGVLLSGTCFYLSLGLTGNYGYFFWIAPIPVLALSFKTSAGKGFIIAFAAYLLGRLSWLSYLVSVITLVPAIIFTLLLPLIFALIVLAARKVVIKTRHWYSVFAFPVLFTAFEFLLLQFSSDGSAGSIAYSQSRILPLIQIASVTGILGITFVITFIPAAVATAWYFRKQKNKFRSIVGCAVILIAVALLFGIARLSRSSQKSTIRAGLAVIDEKLHFVTQHPDAQKEKLSAKKYAELVSRLAGAGATWIVLPERAVNVNKETSADIISMFSDLARQKHIFIITGYTNLKTEVQRNSALVIDTAGNVLVDYNKVHLVRGLENQFTPGTDPGLFTFNKIRSGIAICKDLDFPGYIKKYGRADVDFLSIPAWDFVKDDWLHSRMAILRGVENGFSEVRTARLGRLTISDPYGRINAEANSSDGKSAILTGYVSIQRLNTIYRRCGEWFGIVNMIAAVFFIFLMVRKTRTQQ